MSNKATSATGRPALPAHLKRCHQVCLKLSQSEYQWLRQQARDCGQTLSQYVRETAMGYRPRPCLSPEEITLARDLHGLSANFNQAMHLANLGHPDLARIAGAIADIGTILHRLSLRQ